MISYPRPRTTNIDLRNAQIAGWQGATSSRYAAFYAQLSRNYIAVYTKHIRIL